jgi:hypothetical protein
MPQPQKSGGSEEALYRLSKVAVERGSVLLGSHPWAWESARWRELAFALLTQVDRVPEQQVRRAANQLEALGLLNVHSLARPEASEAQSSRILEILRENGFDEEHAARGLTAIREAAQVIAERFGGRLQRYLRHYGEVMLGEVGGIFSFSSLTEAEAGVAFTYWLQNVLGMPLSLVDENVQRFCERHGLQPTQLLAAADEMGLNLALVDDLVLLENMDAGPSAATGSDA